MSQAGLFSAVATAFVIESYKLLDKPDNDAYMATALYIIASAANASTNLVLPRPPALSLSASPTSRWINGLWFTSLLLSLSVALLSILVKQWIGEYTARNSATAQSPRHWARRRQLYFQALMAWRVAELVSVLPVLLHLALFFFFAGVAAFLLPFDETIGACIILLGVLLFVFYGACTFIPLWKPEIPTSTPLLNQIRRLWVLSQIAALQSWIRLSEVVSRLQGLLQDWARMPKEAELELSAPAAPEDSSASFWQDTITMLKSCESDKSIILQRLHRQHDALDASALQWLIFEVSDSGAVAVGVQALGALHPESAIIQRLQTNTRLPTITSTLR